MSANRQRKIGKRISRQRRRRMRILFGLGLVCVIIIVVVTYVNLSRYVNQVPKNRICDKVYLGEVDVSGMTQKEAKAAMNEHLVSDGARILTMKVGEGSAEASLSELGLAYDNPDRAVKRAAEYGKKGNLFTRYRQMKKLKKEKLVLNENFVLNQKMAKSVLSERADVLAGHAKNAQITRTESGFEITEEQKGKAVDVKASIGKITKYLNEQWKHDDFAMKMKMKTEKPSVKAEDLASIQDELGAFSTDAGGGERWQNLQTGVEHINGTILMPGEQFSVHNATAPYDAEHGYVEAGSYENGQVVDSFGGGICQVSTTLYNAVLYAELDVVERYPHSMLVGYVDPSRDAAIAGDYLDFVFQNSYDTPVYIAAEIDSVNQMCFTIYGKDTRPADRTVEYESETLTTEEYTVTYRENSEAAIGSMEYVGSPHTGKTAQLWKVVYQGGEEVSREVINSSAYEKSDEIVEVGTKSDSSSASALVSGAISSQNESTIYGAIAQAGGM